jgi:hypothetical protein
MDEDEFWTIIETARAMPRPLSEALVDLLVELPLTRILDYEERFDALHEAVYRWDVWAAAYLIGGGCSDDSFMDFRAGLIGLGREWYERAAETPDSLAGHPLVVAAGSADDLEEALFYEDLNYVAMHAYERKTGVDGSFYEAQDEREVASPKPDGPSGLEPMGEDFDFDDEAEMRQRLPRLSALCFDE